MTNLDQAHVANLLDKARDALSVGRVFGDPIHQGDTVIIPVARVVGGGGGGSGSGDGAPGGPDSAGTDAAAGAGAAASGGSGAGGGFGGVATPVGVYVIRNGEVTWQPAVHPERLALAGMALTAFALWLFRSMRR